MHVLQPKHYKLKEDDIKKLLVKYNVSLAQIPKISKTDPVLPQDCKKGDVIRVERKTEEGVQEYFRVVI